MDRLINAILNLSREGRRGLHAEPVDLGKLFDSAAATVQHQLEASGARIELDNGFPVIISDRLSLEQFYDLLDSARSRGFAVRRLTLRLRGAFRLPKR
jgi:signal transduction histidine kinase